MSGSRRVVELDELDVEGIAAELWEALLGSLSVNRYGELPATARRAWRDYVEGLIRDAL